MRSCPQTGPSRQLRRCVPGRCGGAAHAQQRAAPGHSSIDGALSRRWPGRTVCRGGTAGRPGPEPVRHAGPPGRRGVRVRCAGPSRPGTRTFSRRVGVGWVANGRRFWGVVSAEFPHSGLFLEKEEILGLCRPVGAADPDRQTIPKRRSVEEGLTVTQIPLMRLSRWFEHTARQRGVGPWGGGAGTLWLWSTLPAALH